MSATPLHIAQMRRAVCQRQLSILFKELEALRYRKPLKAADSAKFVQLLPRRALIKILFLNSLIRVVIRITNKTYSFVTHTSHPSKKFTKICRHT